MSRLDFVSVYVDPNDMHFKISKGVTISTRQVGSRKTATAEVVYYLERFTQNQAWVPVLMSAGTPQQIIDHINQVYKTVTPKQKSESVVDEINNTIDSLEDKLKDIIGDVESINQESTEEPEWKKQYEDLKAQLEDLKKGTKDLENITPETVQEYEDKVESKDNKQKNKK